MSHGDVQAFLKARDPLPDPASGVDPLVMETTFHAIIAQPRGDARATSHAPRRKRRWWAAAGVPAVAAITALIVFAIGGGTPGRSFPTAVAKLAKLASSPTAVVHTVVSGDDVEGAPGARREMWATVDGSVLRSRTTQPGGSYTDVLLRDDGTRRELTLYRSTDDTLYESHGASAIHAGDPAALSISHIADYAQAIKAGTARLTGEETVNGVAAYRIEQRVPGPASADTQVWVVAQDSAAPRLLRIERPCPPSTRPCPATTFSAYDISNDRSTLQMPNHSAAKVIHVIPPNGSPTR
jgi:hypothetical protein